MAGTFKGIVRDLSGKGAVTRGIATEGSDESTSNVEENEKVPQAATEKAG